MGSAERDAPSAPAVMESDTAFSRPVCSPEQREAKLDGGHVAPRGMEETMGHGAQEGTVRGNHRGGKQGEGDTQGGQHAYLSDGRQGG